MYRRIAPDRVSWAQATPSASLELTAALGLAGTDPVVDVGGGASGFAGELAARGHCDVTVLDISDAALERSRDRVGPAAGIRWVRADVREWLPERRYALWHDRAVFHFLIHPADRARYAATLRAVLRPDGHAIVATFAADGPNRCSGLPVAGYEPTALVAALGPGLRLVTARREIHVTPAGVAQPFTWVLVRRGPDEPVAGAGGPG